MFLLSVPTSLQARPRQSCVNLVIASVAHGTNKLGRTTPHTAAKRQAVRGAAVQRVRAVRVTGMFTTHTSSSRGRACKTSDAPRPPSTWHSARQSGKRDRETETGRKSALRGTAHTGPRQDEAKRSQSPNAGRADRGVAGGGGGGERACASFVFASFV